MSFRRLLTGTEWILTKLDKIGNLVMNVYENVKRPLKDQYSQSVQSASLAKMFQKYRHKLHHFAQSLKIHRVNAVDSVLVNYQHCCG